jgi:hypothetical protein
MSATKSFYFELPNVGVNKWMYPATPAHFLSQFGSKRGYRIE